MSEVATTETTDAPAGMRRGQVATAAGLNIETLRYYERRGLHGQHHSFHRSVE